MDRAQHRKLLKIWQFTTFVQFVVDGNEDADGRYARLLLLMKQRKDFSLYWIEKLEQFFRDKYQLLLKKRKKIPMEIERLFLQNEILDVTGDDEVCIINMEDTISVDRVEISDDEEPEANLSTSVSAESRDSQKAPANSKSSEAVADDQSSGLPAVTALDESRQSQKEHASCKSPETAEVGQTATSPRHKAMVRAVEQSQEGSPTTATSKSPPGSENGPQPTVSSLEPSDDDEPSTSAQARARLAAARSLEQIHKEAATSEAGEAVDENETLTAAIENAENGQNDSTEDCILWEDAADFMHDETEATSSEEPLFSRRERVPAATKEWESELLAQLHSKKGDDLAKYLRSLAERLTSAKPSSTASPETAKTVPIPRNPVRYNGSISNYQPQPVQPVLPPAGPTIQMRGYQRNDPRILRKLADLRSCLQDPQTRASVASLMNYYGGARAPPGQQAPTLPAIPVQRPVQRDRTVPGFTPAPLNYREHKKAIELENQRKEEAKKREEERRKQMERAREEARRQEEEHQRQELAKKREEERRKQMQMAKEARRHKDGEGEEPGYDDSEPHKENARDNLKGGMAKTNRNSEGKMDSQEKTDRQLMRVLRGLETNMNTDHITPIRLDGKRRSSLSARSAIKAQLTARWPADKESEKSPSTNRRKSLDVRTFFTSSPMKIREGRKSVDARLHHHDVPGRGDREATPCRSEGASSPKRRRRAKSVSSRGDATKRRCISEHQSESPKRTCSDDAIRMASFQQCVVRLKRVELPAAVASRASTPARSSRTSTHTVTSPSAGAATIATTPSIKIPASGSGSPSAGNKDTVKETIRWKPPPKQNKAIEPRRNTNHKMTERNTKVCILCRARPRYMTQHFVWKHQTESYVSRLTDSELDALTMTSRFVKLIAVDVYNPHSSRYTTDCRFCGEQLESTFHELHYHFSQHTGEFSYQCADCECPMAYKHEMAPHRERTRCRGGVKRMYSYPEQLQVIYLHCCVVCNFVQLNEANVYRHLRMQHDKAVDDATLVKRLVLAAINDPNEGERDAETTEASGEAEPDLLDGPSEEPEPINVVNEPVVDDFDGTVAICKEEPDNDLDLFEAIENICPNSDSIGVTVKQEVIVAESCDILDGTLALPPMISIPSLQIGKQQHEESVSMPNADAAGVSSQDAGEGYNGAGEQPESISKPRTDFRAYSAGDSCYGLFKCMAADCIYSSDEAEPFLAHLEEHTQSSNPPENMLECAYCLLPEAAWSPALLVEHIQTVHGNSRYQCSVCSYRSCSFSNVYTHWQSQGPEHKDNPPLIYECGDPVENSNAPEVALNRAKECAASNVRPLKCTNCALKFYGLNRLEAHGKVCPSGKESLNMTQFHKRKFSCVYCELDVMSIEELRCHLADQHYDEHPYGCERVTLMRDGAEADDAALSLHFLNLSKDFAKDYIAAAPRPAAAAEESEDSGGVTVKTEVTECDEKPNAQQLVELNVLMVKPLLMKLTESTGIGPDKLYQCPHAECGGFFSRFQFWSRHMLATHGSIMPACPHCPGEESVELSLDEYEQHFELHRRKLHVCYYCGEACGTETVLYTHLQSSHERTTAAPQVKRFDVTCYLTYSYHVLMYLEDFESDLQVLQELQSVLRKRIETNAVEERGRFVSQWSVPASVKWLETLPSFVPADLHLECRSAASGCQFKSSNLDQILQHQMAHHPQAPHYRCPYPECKDRRLYKTWIDIIDHHRAHRQYLYVCCHCSFYHHSNNGMIGHIRTEHDSCDVPVIALNRSSTSISVSISVVMATGKRTLSPKRCFCCDQQVTTLVSHLKSAHGLVMQYVCELCNTVFLALTESELHQRQHHPGVAYKLRCNFKLLGHLAISESQPLAIEILARNDVSAKNHSNDKNKPAADDNDDDVTMLDDDDIIIEEELKKMAATNGPSKAIALKCIPIGNLTDSAAPAENQMDRPAPPLSTNAVVLPNMSRQHSTTSRETVTLVIRPPATQQAPVLPNQPASITHTGVPSVITPNSVSQARLPTRPPQQIPVLLNRPRPVSTQHTLHSVQQQSQLRQICMSVIERQIREPQQQLASNQSTRVFQYRMNRSALEGNAIRSPTTQFPSGQNTNAMVPQQFYPNGPQTSARNPEPFPRPTELQQLECLRYPTYGHEARQFNSHHVTASHQNPQIVPIQHQQQHPCKTQNAQPLQQPHNNLNNRGAPPTNQLQQLPNSSHNRGAPSASQLQTLLNSSHNRGPPSANQLQQLPNSSLNRGALTANRLQQLPNSSHHRGSPSANQLQQLPNSSHNHGASSTNYLQELLNSSYNRGAPSTNHLPQNTPASNQHALPPVHDRQQSTVRQTSNISVIRLATNTQELLPTTANANLPQIHPNQQPQVHRPW